MGKFRSLTMIFPGTDLSNLLTHYLTDGEDPPTHFCGYVFVHQTVSVFNVSKGKYSQCIERDVELKWTKN